MISRELYKKIRAIEIHAARLVVSQLAGPYHSVFKGRGMAFSEVRPYSPGDEVRAIDWNVSARMNEPHVKLFTEERDRTVMLLLDMSASGMIGSGAQSKLEMAAEVAALIALSAIENHDRVGLILFTDRVELFVPPRKGRRHVLRLIREMVTHAPAASGTSLGVALERLGMVCRDRAVAFVLSDFLDDGWDKPLRCARRRHDVIPVILGDPIEDALPRLGLVAFEDVESGAVVEIDTSGAEADEYRAAVVRVRAARDAVFRRMELDIVDVRTDRPYVDALVRFFDSRQSRRARAGRRGRA